ncbi:MAG: hypothetical protein ACR2KE_01495 [Candidatus Nanopelagicales bacterium]
MSEESNRRMKDFWTLHLPLVLVLALCTVATVIEVRRAFEGVGRAAVYSIQWPIIGLFAIVIWNRYRKHGNITRWFTDRYSSRIAAYKAEAEAEEAARRAVEESTPEAQAWQAYMTELRRQQDSDRPPS